MLAVKVKKETAEKVKKTLFNFQVINKDYKIAEKANFVYFPLKRKPDAYELRILNQYNLKLIYTSKFFERNKYPTPFENIMSKIALPMRLVRLLPTKWELLGDVLVLKIHSKLTKFEKKLAKVYANELGANTVVKDVGGISGEFRVPAVKLIYGKRTETIHKESGIKFKFDVAKIMFSSGNIHERQRMAKISSSREVVVDMFAGIGYFSIPMAIYSKPSRIYACEINPVAFRYLCENIRLNKVEDILTPLFGDNRKIAPENIADRILMGYIGSTYTYLSKAIKILKPEGGVIHFHETCPEELLPDRPFEKVRRTVEKFNRKAKLLSFVNIKSYAPGISHVVLDIKITNKN